MPTYSVIITLQGDSREEIRSKLRSTLGRAIAQGAVINEAGVPVDCYQACLLNDHFGCVHWTDEDLRTKLHELEVPISTDALESLRGTYSLRHIDDRMIELGWEIIRQGILDAGVVLGNSPHVTSNLAVHRHVVRSWAWPRAQADAMTVSSNSSVI